MATVDELVKLWGKDTNPEVQDKTVRDVLDFALTATDYKQLPVVCPGADRLPRRIRLLGKDVSNGVIVVRLLGKEVHPSIHRQTAKCLADLADSHENQMKIASYPDVLDVLVSVLVKAGGAVVHEETARCLANLAQTRENHVKMASSNVLGALVRLLEKDGLPSVHLQTARCLTNLAESPANLERIASYPQALDALVRRLGYWGSSSDHINVHEQTAQCLTYLARFEKNQLEIVSYPGALAALVCLLGKNGTSRVQRQAAKLLTALSDHYRINKVKIASSPDVLDALFRLLSGNWITTGRISVQMEAAMCLANLVSAPANQQKICFHPGALVALVKCLEPKNYRLRKVQSLAAECLNSLADAADNRVKIVSYPGAIRALVSLLVQDVNPNAREPAAWCLSRLAITQEVKVTIASDHNLLDALARLPGTQSSVNCKLDQPLVRIVASLALCKENKERIASHPRILDALVRLLRDDVDPIVLEQTAKCLCYLAGASENAGRIASHPGILEALVSLLQDYSSPGVLENVVKCLSNLASSQENQVKKAIVFFRGILSSLVRLLRKKPKNEVSLKIQEQVVTCLDSLALAPEVEQKIASFPSVHSTLRRLATDDVNSILQEKATWCLGTLKLSAVADRHTRSNFGGQSIGLQRRQMDQQDSLSDPDWWCVDPLTYDLMCDPVKCNDGVTYDRWTILDYNISKSPYNRRVTPFLILCDDIDVRRRLFLTFPNQENKFRERRQKYREQALLHAQAGEVSDAIEKLMKVLQWWPSDGECEIELRRLLDSGTEQSTQERLLLADSPEHDYVFPALRAESPALSRQVSIPDQPSLILDPIDQTQTFAIPIVVHEDLMTIREKEGGRRALVMVLLYVGILYLLTALLVV